MCVYDKRLANKRYQPNKSNGGVAPIPKYDVLKGVTAKCGKCIDCRKARGQEWAIRLREELKSHGWKAQFVTLTFSDHAIEHLVGVTGTEEANTVVKHAVRRFLERHRRNRRRPLRHWFATELGQKSTERMHLHGILFGTDMTEEELSELWKYGRVDIGYKCDETTINYIVKYITKVDPVHKEFSSMILTSPGMGKAYLMDEENRRRHAYKEEKTDRDYILPDGRRVAMPEYYRRRMWTDEEREEMTVYDKAKGKAWVGGIEYNVRTYEETMTFERARDARRVWIESIGFPPPKRGISRTYRMVNRHRKKE